MTRHEDREKAMITIYQYLITSKDIESLIEDNYPENEKDEYIQKVIHQVQSNVDRYHAYIDEVLDEWTYDRLGYMEKAILLIGCGEFDLKQVEAPVIIDESIRLAKQYCDEDSYKLINGVLDKI